MQPLQLNLLLNQHKLDTTGVTIKLSVIDMDPLIIQATS